LRLCEKKRIRRAQGEKKEKKGAQSRQAAKSAAAESNTERTTVSLRLCAFARLKNKKNPPLNVEFYIQKVIPTQEMEHRLKVGIDPKKRVNGKKTSLKSCKYPSNPSKSCWKWSGPNSSYFKFSLLQRLSTEWLVD
jgi:hypothetical protein